MIILQKKKNFHIKPNFPSNIAKKGKLETNEIENRLKNGMNQWNQRGFFEQMIKLMNFYLC